MFNLYFYFEVAALLVACAKYKTLTKTAYRHLLPFMVFIVAYETCSLYNIFTVKGSNLWIANLVALGEFVFFGLIISRLLNSLRYQKFVAVAVGIVTVYTVASIFLIAGFWKLDISAIIIQTIVIISIAGRYFWELMEVPFSNSLSLIKQPGFWLNTGVLFYYLGEFMFFASFSYMAYKNNLTYFYLFVFVSNLSNAILYSCLITCFLCLKPTRESYQLS